MLQLITRLPHAWQIKVGAGLGWLAYRLAVRRRHIAEVNIALCFPHLSANAQAELIRKTFRSTGIGLVETASTWLRDVGKLASRVEIRGLAHLQSALDEGRGVLLLGMHSSTMDYCGAALSTHIAFDVMYRRNKNPLLEHLMIQGRQKNFPLAIERSDIRRVLKQLKQGHVVWYGADQDYGHRHSVFAPFFNVATATITATARFARITQAPVVFLSHYRTLDDQGYVLTLSKPLKHYPIGDDAADARYINRIIEQAILKAPEQYWWIHRRFKTRPNVMKRPY